MKEALKDVFKRSNDTRQHQEYIPGAKIYHIIGTLDDKNKNSKISLFAQRDYGSVQMLHTV